MEQTTYRVCQFAYIERREMSGFPDFKWYEIILAPFYLLYSFIKDLFRGDL